MESSLSSCSSALWNYYSRALLKSYFTSQYVPWQQKPWSVFVAGFPCEPKISGNLFYLWIPLLPPGKETLIFPNVPPFLYNSISLTEPSLFLRKGWQQIHTSLNLQFNVTLLQLLIKKKKEIFTYFINKNDGWLELYGQGEDSSSQFLGFSIPFVRQRGGLKVDEPTSGFLGCGFGNQGFPTSRGAIEEDSWKIHSVSALLGQPWGCPGSSLILKKVRH